MQRAINRRQQGDLGEASAIEWLTSKGALVLIPFGHSPHFDLVAEIENQLLRIQVKTTAQTGADSRGGSRFVVTVATRGGNRSWSGVSKLLDTSRFDFLFVLTASGRRWFIPAGAIDGRSAISLGGSKYSECEIEPGQPFQEIVFPGANLESRPRLGEYPRGQRMATVNRPAQPSQVRLLPPPLASPKRMKPTNYERKPGQRGEALINQKRRLTIPQRPLFEAGLANGGRVRVRADGPGRLVVEQIELPAWAQEHRAGEPDASPPSAEVGLLTQAGTAVR